MTPVVIGFFSGQWMQDRSNRDSDKILSIICQRMIGAGATPICETRRCL